MFGLLDVLGVLDQGRFHQQGRIRGQCLQGQDFRIVFEVCGDVVLHEQGACRACWGVPASRACRVIRGYRTCRACWLFTRPRSSGVCRAVFGFACYAFDTC